VTRERLSPERLGFTRKFKIMYVEPEEEAREPHLREVKTLKFYVQVGLYEDGRLGEIFIHGDKIGGLVSGALDALAMIVSVALQHGIPLQDLTNKLRHHQFGPSGMTGDPDFPTCSSMFDLLAQWLDRKFPNGRLTK
jgi:hypothetical protein